MGLVIPDLETDREKEAVGYRYKVVFKTGKSLYFSSQQEVEASLRADGPAKEVVTFYEQPHLLFDARKISVMDRPIEDVFEDAFREVTGSAYEKIFESGFHEGNRPKGQVAHYSPTSFLVASPQAAHRSGIPWDIVEHFSLFEVSLRHLESDYEYAVWDHGWPNPEVFHGHDFSPTRRDKKDKAAELLMLLSSRPSEVGEEFFVNYLPEQLQWRDECAEQVRLVLAVV